MEPTPNIKPTPRPPHSLPRDAFDRTPSTRAKHYLGPITVSVACHTVVLFLLVFASWVAKPIDEPILTEYEATIVTEPKNLGSGGGFRFPGNAHIDRPNSAADSDESEQTRDLASLLAKEEAFQPKPIEAGGSGIETIAVPTLGRDDVVGFSSGHGGGPERGGLGSGLSGRGLPGGGPVGTLWGVGEGQHGESVVYVMDRSGSMGEVFGILKRELKRAIGSLDRDQSFNVIWFNEGEADDLFQKLRPATMNTKREAFRAIDLVFDSGQTEPINAVRRGLAYKPDVLFLLSDGDFRDDNLRVLRMIEKMNADQNTTINTILFVYDVMGEGERVLRAIAEANNGTYKHVTEEDIRY